jgi:hypothetical protein
VRIPVRILLAGSVVGVLSTSTITAVTLTEEPPAPPVDLPTFGRSTPDQVPAPRSSALPVDGERIVALAAMPVQVRAGESAERARVEAQRIEAARVEAQRREAARREARQVEAARPETEQAQAQRRAAGRVDARQGVHRADGPAQHPAHQLSPQARKKIRKEIRKACQRGGPRGVICPSG